MRRKTVAGFSAVYQQYFSQRTPERQGSRKTGIAATYDDYVKSVIHEKDIFSKITSLQLSCN
jgi:hypothetical protein